MSAVEHFTWSTAASTGACDTNFIISFSTFFRKSDLSLVFLQKKKASFHDQKWWNKEIPCSFMLEEVPVHKKKMMFDVYCLQP